MSNNETQRKDMTERNNPSEKKPSRASNFGYAVGGFIAGAATSSAFSMPSGSDEEIIETDIINESGEGEGEAEVVIDTMEETTYTHVGNSLPHYEQAPVAHVSDSQSFAQAFADARQQVGPGGCFEWHGKLYGTYYENEWTSMTAEQRSDYLASINAADVHGNNPHDDNPHDADVVDNRMASNTELIDDDPEPVMKVEDMSTVSHGAPSSVAEGSYYFDLDSGLLYHNGGVEVDDSTQIASVEPDFNDYQPTGLDDLIAMEGGSGFDDIA